MSLLGSRRTRLNPRVEKCILDLHLRDGAQDLIEYALIATMFALLGTFVLRPITHAVSSGVTEVGKRFKQHTDHGLHKGWYK